MNVHGYKPAKFKLALSTIPALGLLNLSVTKFVAKLPPLIYFVRSVRGVPVWSVRSSALKSIKIYFYSAQATAQARCEFYI